MELILQQSLPHQQKAVDSICAALDGVRITSSKMYYENPRISLEDPRLAENIRRLQDGIPSEYRSCKPIGNWLNLDIKMETGTGKTYVYTKVIYELHKRFGLNKFIIVVPSLAIKAGTEQFLQDDYVKRHFSDSCGYDTEIEVGVLEAPKNKKKGRSYFPSVVSDFVKGSSQNARKIHVLLLNMQLLTSAKILTRDDYDNGVAGFYKPINAIQATRPVVIIDEPHRFSRSQSAFKTINNKIEPQCIIRFGATFPETSKGSGTNKVTVKDYENLLYDLNACESFNQNLIKGVAKEHFEPPSRLEEKVKIAAIAKNDSVKFQHKKRDEPTKTYTLQSGDPLSMISNAFQGITIKAIGQSSVEFSNGIVKFTGQELDVNIYMTSYQEQMIKLALERHFETEKENFCDRTFRIKTLALFFIDDITSYRQDGNGKSPYLLKAFERLLKERIEIVLKNLDSHYSEYRAYLEASLEKVSACHAGYFSRDNSDSDNDIAEEVDIILHGKKQLLSFQNEDGSYNTLRFLFSKWTLKEGWDNPNVFTIAKLRSSGSENSKLQEVGRGLRLPVDENGNRISNEEFQLNYIVDFTEKDFAERLIDQINGEIPQATVISEERIRQIAQNLGVTPDDLVMELMKKKYIDWQRKITPETRNAFFSEYPDFETGLSSNKVKDLNKQKAKPIGIRKTAYREIKELWEAINQRYLLFYDEELDAHIEDVVLSLFEKPGVFKDVVMTSTRDVVKSDGTQITSVSQTGVQYTATLPIPYNVFLKRIARNTNVPLTTLHKAVCTYSETHGNIDHKYFNENSVSAFCSEFQTWKTESLQGRFSYVKSNTSCKATALTHKDGAPRDTIAQGRIGTKIMPGSPSPKYLYDTYAYDSPLEQKNITTDIDQVVVYGKIPRSSIAIPTITGGTYSPDFMYIVKRTSGESSLHIVIETKGVENEADLRGNEKAKIDCARVFFENLKIDGFHVHFREQLNSTQIAQIINELLLE